MVKKEMVKILKKIEIVLDWYDEMTAGEFSASNWQAQDLIDKLDAE